MALFTCKMCGGELEIIDAENNLAQCESCGKKQTLPSEADERKANQFNRANHYRRSNEFDRAAEAYAKILDTDPGEAEAYWGIVLCRYGIEYVEDKKTMRRVPTCHRTLTRSILQDPDYQQTLTCAKPLAKLQYEEEAKEIDRLQKEILALAGREDPFDIFISYKETDERTGQRTQDSVLAQDIYTALTKEGYKVFFSRITLENRLGQDYEPIIYAALRSAKVMLAVGTRPEYFEAPWVRNEWNRYWGMMEEEPGAKTLIPVYRDMDAYDLPEEFSHLQGINAANIGFVQDLVHGIEKLMERGSAVISTAPTGSEALLDRTMLFLENGDFEQAEKYSQRYLDHAPRDYRGYVAALMAQFKCRKDFELGRLEEKYYSNSNYQSALRFAPPSKKAELTAWADNANKLWNEKNYQESLKSAQKWEASAEKSNEPGDWRKAADLYAIIKDDENRERCWNKAHDILMDKAKKKERMADEEHSVITKCNYYENAAELYDEAEEEEHARICRVKSIDCDKAATIRSGSVQRIQEVKELYQQIGATERVKQCEQEIQRIQKLHRDLDQKYRECIKKEYQYKKKANIVQILCAFGALGLSALFGRPDGGISQLLFWYYLPIMCVTIVIAATTTEYFDMSLFNDSAESILKKVLMLEIPLLLAQSALLTAIVNDSSPFLGIVLLSLLPGIVGIPVSYFGGIMIGVALRPLMGNNFAKKQEKLKKEKESIQGNIGL